ncbi:hypothetical protein LMH87_009320 [Akanthomyces muscarius]|uniref:Amidase domain-containing protein n=1 Tax=Akanthomyces muscarius TaxID=2231603 RepID=A0A9W8ULS6_AKAMU|nr:hypothetical protein LMH87_009320 [Akanthomyces muscarius]KAJ4152800.1 hypothetical protein LMH87_009320 [Akanthomyces muscarius]
MTTVSAVKTTTYAVIMPLAILSAVFASYWYAFGGARNVHPFDPYHPHWQTVVSAKKAELAAKIPQEWLLSQTVIDDARSRRSIAGDFLDSLLDPRNRDITTREPAEIVHDIASGNLSSVDVVTAFCKRASYIHQISPAFLEIGFDLALARARELDEYFNTHGQTVGPLHGLPITLKDHFHIKGLETSFGYVEWIGTFQGKKGTGKEKNVESELIRQLISVGAVPIAKITLMSYLLEGPLGARLSCKHLEAVQSALVVGVMGPSISALRLVFKSLMETRPWEHDPSVLPIPWRSDQEVPPDAILSFGFMENDGVVAPHPPIARALEIASSAVKNKDHSSLPGTPPLMLPTPYMGPLHVAMVARTCTAHSNLRMNQ